jgi:hypothetical protein
VPVADAPKPLWRRREVHVCAPCGVNHREEDGGGLASPLAAGEEPVPAKRGGADGALDRVVVDGQAAVCCVDRYSVQLSSA